MLIIFVAATWRELGAGRIPRAKDEQQLRTKVNRFFDVLVGPGSVVEVPRELGRFLLGQRLPKGSVAG